MAISSRELGEKYMWSTTVQDGNSMAFVYVDKSATNLIDPVRNMSVRDSVSASLEAYIRENSNATESELQSLANSIVKRAEIHNQEKSSRNLGYENNINSHGLNTQFSDITGVRDPNVKHKVDYGDESRNNGGLQFRDETIGPLSLKNPKKENKGGNRLEDTIGGADLCVFYMTEMPVMEDVLTPNLHRDAWRKELIIFELDSVLSLSYSTIRERFPVRILGQSNPKAYTAGPRTIAGHIAFAVFAEDVLARLRSQVSNSFASATKGFKEKLIDSKLSQEEKDELERNRLTLAQYYDSALQFDSVQLLDSLPPFHLMIMGMNESGVFSKMIIKNVSIVDENQYQGTTQPNIVNKCSFVAADIIPMAKLSEDSNAGESIGSLTENYYNGFNPSKLKLFSASDLLESRNIGKYK